MDDLEARIQRLEEAMKAVQDRLGMGESENLFPEPEDAGLPHRV